MKLHAKYALLTTMLSVSSLTMISVAEAAQIKAVRCSGGIAKLKMDKFEVIDRCGTPLDREVISALDERKVERMVYRFSTSESEPLTIFTFEEGKLTLIEKNP